MECPKCGYVRQPVDTAPDYECPQCGIIYAKYRAPEKKPEAVPPKPPAGKPSGKTAADTPCAESRQERSVSPEDFICKSCGMARSVQASVKGSGWIEVVLYLCGVVLGVIYSIWRRANTKNRCASCGGQELILVGSPVGQKLMAEFNPGVAISGDVAKAKVMSAVRYVSPEPAHPAVKWVGYFLLTVLVLVLIFPFAVLLFAS